MAAEKLSPEAGAQTAAVHHAGDREAAARERVQETHEPPATGLTALVAPEAGAGDAARAASIAAAHGTIGTARLNRLMNPPIGGDRRSPSTQSAETLPIGAAEAARAPAGGQPLETGVRRSIERTVATDLSDVRVHTGPDANAAAQSLSARAFTSGKDIFLGPGENPSDTRLIAHEAAHVEEDPHSPTPRRYTPSGGDERESHARSVAERAVRGAGVPAPTATATPNRRLRITDRERAEMKADVEQIVAELKGFLTDEWKIAGFAIKWAERDRACRDDTGYDGHAYIDGFVLETQKRAYTRRTLRGAAWTAELHGIVYDDVWNQLDGERLRIWKDRVSKSRWGTGGPREGPPENFWKTLSRQEAIGIWGILKGMGTSAASGLVDAPAKAIVHALQAARVPAAEPESAAAWLEKQYDISGEAMFGKEFTHGELLWPGTVTAAQLGTSGGAVIWQLVMLGSGKAGGDSALKAGKAATWAAKGLVALGILGNLESVGESAAALANIVLAKQAAGKKITAADLANDPDFRRAGTNLIANIVGAVSSAMGLGNANPDAAKAATMAAWRAAGLVVSGAQVGERLGTCVQEALSTDPPGEKDRKIASLLGDALSAAIDVTVGVHESRQPSAAGALPPEVERRSAPKTPVSEPDAPKPVGGAAQPPARDVAPPPSPVPAEAVIPAVTAGSLPIAAAVKPRPTEVPAAPPVPVATPAPETASAGQKPAGGAKPAPAHATPRVTPAPQQPAEAVTPAPAQPAEPVTPASQPSAEQAAPAPSARREHTAEPTEHSQTTELTPRTLRERVPGVVRMSRPRRRALEIMNRLGPEDRETVVKVLAGLEPNKAGKLLRAIGRLKDEHALMDWMRHKDGGTAGLSAMETFLGEQGPGKPDLEDVSLKVEERVTVRVTPEQVQAGRRALRVRMNEHPPDWAKDASGRYDPEAWNAHHLIPVENQNHWVFDVLRATKEGWDHNAPVNGIALPTTPEARDRSGLPVHQVTRKLLLEARSKQKVQQEIPSGVLRDLQGHPNINRDVKAALDALTPYEHDPTTLRQEVLRIIADQRTKITTGDQKVLF